MAGWFKDLSGTVKTALCRPSYWVNRNEYHGFGVTQTMSMKLKSDVLRADPSMECV